MKREKIKIRIVTSRDKDKKPIGVEDVMAEPYCDGLTMHKRNGRWKMTHVASGLITIYAPTRKALIECADRLDYSKMLDWTLEEQEVLDEADRLGIKDMLSKILTYSNRCATGACLKTVPRRCLKCEMEYRLKK